MNESTPGALWQRIHDLLKEVKDETGSSINVRPLYDRLVPAFFDSSPPTPLARSLKDDRNAGYLAFYQSFSTYTVTHYNALSTAFLERILLQTVSLSPIAKIADCLGLGDNQYDSSYESGDRLSILLGVLVSYYGSSVVDSFLHPLFKQHIFNEKHIPQPDQGTTILQLENLVQSRGGNIDFYYQQREVACPQAQSRWECTITYQFGPNTPFILHHRTGQSKKYAKLRTLHDIYNYYSRSDTDLVLHCASWLTNHPHCQPQLPNTSNKINVTPLSIPIEQMYEYDDDRYEHMPLAELVSKRLNDNFIHISADTCEDAPDEYLSFLTQALLGDPIDPNKNNNGNDSPKASPLPATTQQQQDDQQSPPSSSSSPLPSKTDWVPSTSTLSNTGLKLAKVDELSSKRSPVMENYQHTTSPTSSSSSNALNIDLLTDYGNQSVPSTSSCKPTLPSPPTQAPAPAPIPAKAPGELLPTEQHLVEKATQLMDLFTVKERCRLNDYSEHLRHKPNDTKGTLMNLARKLDDGYYDTTVEHVRLGKTTERAHYIATVKFGNPEVELTLARGHTKKSTAEGLAALAIFGLLERAAKTINTGMKLPFLD